MLKILSVLFIAIILFLTVNFGEEKNDLQRPSPTPVVETNKEDTFGQKPTRQLNKNTEHQIRTASSFSHSEENVDVVGDETMPLEEDERALLEHPTPTPHVAYHENDDTSDENDSLLFDVLKNHEEQGENSKKPSRSFIRTTSQHIKEGGKLTKPTPTPEPLPMVGGQARGYAMLYLMHPRAKAVVEAQIQTLIDARIKDVYLGVLVDGTFSKNHQYLREVLKRLHEAGRIITLEQYFASGPTMRRYETTPIKTVFSKLEPLLFRSRDLFNGNIQNEIKNIAREADETFKFNTALNPDNKNFASVMLEDNLDSGAYDKMKSIALEAMSSQVIFIRNACPGCYPGNDAERRGDLLELHSLPLFPDLTTGDGYTLDGVDVAYPHETDKSDIGIDELTYMLQVAYMKKLSFFGLWKKTRQGLNDAQGQLLHPDSRTYIPPTEEERRVEIELLRESQELLEESGD